MRSAFSRLTLLTPKSLEQALHWMSSEESLIPMAGCTDLYVSLNMGQPVGNRFLNLWGLPELQPIRISGNLLSLGALVTYSELIASREVQDWLPILVSASREIGGVQIQNRGTLGGNIANASPAGDSLPVLAAAEAMVVLQSVRGIRRIPFNSFYTGYRQSVRRPDELIVAVEIPRQQGRQWFRKVGTRAAQAISKVVMAAVRDVRPRIAFGSLAPTVVRVPEVEEHLASGGSIEEAQRILKGTIKPIDDLRSTARYRLQVAANLLARFWQETEEGRKASGLTSER